ncbi:MULTISPECIES: glycosyltransferase family 4 protein [unclassified Dyella]|uniref:glycosyltransferase family 4 protein n=1 Tax=unclassified Dyella TaxID=2634549 RepID=UPI003F90B9EC
MRLLFLSKRHPQQRDLLLRPYGRFFHLPRVLAEQGHQVEVLLCSHHKLPEARKISAGVKWTSLDVRTLGPMGLWKRLATHVDAMKPDWIIGCSDIWFGLLARQLAKRSGARLALDAYDNFEAYIPWNLPLHFAWRRAIRSADLVTAAGPQLAQLLQSYRRKGIEAHVVPMAADPEFVEKDKHTCRLELNLPVDAPLFGYVGSWSKNRGTDVLIRAFRKTLTHEPRAKLVVSGKPPAHVLEEPGVIATGYLTDEQLPILLNALDVAYVITADTSFGRYSYPAKLCEAMACGVPVVATSTEPVRWMLKDNAVHIAPVGNAHALSELTLALLKNTETSYGNLPSWDKSGRQWHDLLVERSP